jgi:hypothetical protein
VRAARKEDFEIRTKPLRGFVLHAKLPRLVNPLLRLGIDKTMLGTILSVSKFFFPRLLFRMGERIQQIFLVLLARSSFCLRIFAMENYPMRSVLGRG